MGGGVARRAWLRVLCIMQPYCEFLLMRQKAAAAAAAAEEQHHNHPAAKDCNLGPRRIL